MSRSGSSSCLQAPLLDHSNSQTAQRGDSTITVRDHETEPLLSGTPRGPDEPTFKQEDYTSLLYNLHVRIRAPVNCQSKGSKCCRTWGKVLCVS
jgi:hypothetical protein